MTVKITYPATGPISTQQMLNLAYRMFNETPGPLVIHLSRVGQSATVHIVLLRAVAGGPISESINIEENSA